MEIYLSVGVSTLVALMEAHRADAGSNQTISAVFDRTEVARIGDDLNPGNPPSVEFNVSLW